MSGISSSKEVYNKQEVIPKQKERKKKKPLKFSKEKH